MNMVNLGESSTDHGPNSPDYKYQDTIFLRGKIFLRDQIKNKNSS